MKGVIESAKKTRVSLTLNPDLVTWLRESAKVLNLSAWVNEQMRDYKLKLTYISRCPCGVESGRKGWAKWRGICPNCGKDHTKDDLRERVI